MSANGRIKLAAPPAPIVLRWVYDNGTWEARGLPTWECPPYRLRNWLIWIEPRPSYCDRGRWVAKCDVPLDAQEGFPRYYFDLEVAKSEIEAWVNARAECKE